MIISRNSLVLITTKFVSDVSNCEYRDLWKEFVRKCEFADLLIYHKLLYSL
jgi:hypothetical protein